MLIYMLYENVGKVGHGLCPLPLQTIPVFLKARRHIGQVEEKQKKRKKDDNDQNQWRPRRKPHRGKAKGERRRATERIEEPVGYTTAPHLEVSPWLGVFNAAAKITRQELSPNLLLIASKSHLVHSLQEHSLAPGATFPLKPFYFSENCHILAGLDTAPTCPYFYGYSSRRTGRQIVVGYKC